MMNCGSAWYLLAGLTILSSLLTACARATGERTLLQAASRNATVNTGPTSGLPDLTAVEAVAALCARNFTAVQYVTALNERYVSGGYSCNNPWITYNVTQALQDAAAVDAKAANGSSIRPLCGLPLAVKDAIDVLGYPTTVATPALADLFPPFSAPLVDQYLNANGIILGKANLGEMQSGYATNPTSNGITTALNPYDPTRTASGSSSGSAVAVAARVAPLALCEDTGGSCRLPGNAQGLYSFRPTIGCYNFSDGLQPYQLTRDTVGSMARTAGDVILLDSIIRNNDFNSTGNGAVAAAVPCAVNVNSSLSLRGVRLGLPSTLGWVPSATYAGISGEIAGVINTALTRIRNAGATLVPFDSTAFDELAISAWPGATADTIPGLDAASNYESIEVLGRWLALHNSSISVTDLIEQINRPAEKAAYQAAQDSLSTSIYGSTQNFVEYIKTGRPAIASYWNTVMSNNSFDALLYPIQNTEVLPIAEGLTYAAFNNETGSYVEPQASFVGNDPQIAGSSGNFPIGLSSSGTPTSLQVVGPPGYDSTILSLLLAMEKLFGDFPGPPNPSLCAGCLSNVTVRSTSYNGTGQPESGEVWSSYGLTFTGANCSSNLTSYGRRGIGVGPAPKYNGTIATVTGVSPTNTSAGTVTA